MGNRLENNFGFDLYFYLHCGIQVAFMAFHRLLGAY